MILSLRVLCCCAMKYRRHLEYTPAHPRPQQIPELRATYLSGIETCRNLRRRAVATVSQTCVNELGSLTDRSAVGCRIANMSSQGIQTDKGVSGPPPDRALLIAAEKVRIQYRNMPTAIVGSAVICTLMGFALLTGAGLGKMIAWMAVVYVWVIARFIQWRAFNRINPSPRDMRPWRRLGIGGSAVAGLIWGVGAVVLYVPHGLAYQLFLVMGLVGMGAGCVYASASVMPSFFAFLYPSILLPAVMFLREDDPLHVTTSALMLVYCR